jgi:putative transposase
MRNLDLVTCQPRPYRPITTPGDPGTIPDLVKRDFTAHASGT